MTNISSIPSWLFDIVFIETNDAYRNLLRKRLLEKLSLMKRGKIPCLKRCHRMRYN